MSEFLQQLINGLVLGSIYALIALGYTMVLPLEDRYSISRNQLLDQIAYAMGGRVAEEIVYGDPTTGASNDFEKATSIAKAMIMQYGMSSVIGSVSYGQKKDPVASSLQACRVVGLAPLSKPLFNKKTGNPFTI